MNSSMSWRHWHRGRSVPIRLDLRLITGRADYMPLLKAEVLSQADKG